MTWMKLMVVRNSHKYCIESCYTKMSVVCSKKRKKYCHLNCVLTLDFGIYLLVFVDDLKLINHTSEIYKDQSKYDICNFIDLKSVDRLTWISCKKEQIQEKFLRICSNFMRFGEIGSCSLIVFFLFVLI